MLNRAAGICIALLILGVLCVNPLKAELIDRYIEELETTRSIPIGAVFYAKETRTPGYRARYTHMGFDDKDLRVKYELIYHTDEIIESEYYNLRLNGKDALLATKPLYGENPDDVTKLLISVVDGFGRVRVQEFKGN